MVLTRDVADRCASTPAPLPRPAQTLDQRHAIPAASTKPRRLTCPLPRGAGTDSHGPMDPPNTRLRHHG